MKTLDGGESVGGRGKPIGKNRRWLFSIVVFFPVLNLSTAHAAPLDVVEVEASAVNCVFDSSCALTVSDTSSTFALPGMAGLGRLQSRTFTGSAGAPAAGLEGYEYRLDLSHVVGKLDIECVTSLTLEFGPVVKNLDYDGSGDVDEVFVIASGGLGNVGPTSASLDGNHVTFLFQTPVCAGSFDGDGDSTFFFGLTSVRSPRTVVAEVETLHAAGIGVGARAPELAVALVFKQIQDAIGALPFDSLAGPRALREYRRRALLKRLSVAERAAENGHTRTALRALEGIAAVVDGVPPDWVVDDPRTEIDEPGALLALVRGAIDALPDSPPPRPRPRARRGSGVRCTVGRYRVEGDPLSSRSSEDEKSVLSLIGGRLALDESCPAVDVSLRDSRAGTIVSAHWPRCEGLPQGASLIGVIDDGTCTSFEGAFFAPGSTRRRSRRVKAHLVLCGEPEGLETRTGDVDEACDPVDRLAVKFLRWRNEFVSRTWPLGYITQDAAIKGYNQTVLAPIPLDQFGSFGPAPILGTTNVGVSSGRVDSVAVDPANPDHWLVGANAGGVWETSDAGAHWAPRTDDQPSLAVSAIAFAPGNPVRVYAGTGEYDSAGGAAGILGAGVLRSDDGGTTWTPLATTALAGLSTTSIQVSGTSSNTLTIATMDGLQTLFGYYASPKSPPPGIYRSTTGGASWSLVLPGSATDVAAHPNDFSRQYAGLRGQKKSTYPAFAPGGVFRSFDGGLNWGPVSGPWSFKNDEPGEIRFAVSPSSPDTVYLSVRDSWSHSGALKGLWRTEDAWAPTPTWTQIPWVGPFPQGYPVGRSTHMVSVHPTDPDVLYATGVLLWKSTDGVWSDASGTQTHADHNALAWAGTRLIAGNDGGVFSREEGDGHKSPGPWTSHNTNLSITQLYGGSAHPLDPTRMLAGAQDNGTLKRLADQLPAWKRIGGADGMGAIPGDNPSHWAYWVQGLGLHRTKTDGASDEVIVGVKEDAAAWKAPVVRCPADADVVLAGSRRVMRAENFFSAAKSADIVWSPNSPALGPTVNQLHLFVTAIAFAPSDGSCATYAYATDEGELHLTTDAGDTWQNIDLQNQVPDRYVMGLAFSPTSLDVLYVALTGFDESTPGAPGHLFRTTGATSPAPGWSDVGPPVNLPHNAVAVNPVDAATLYVGTDMGAWVSQDGATSWKHVGPANGIPNVPVTEIGFDPCGVTLFTFGRGVFRKGGPFVCP